MVISNRNQNVEGIHDNRVIGFFTFEETSWLSELIALERIVNSDSIFKGKITIVGVYLFITFVSLSFEKSMWVL